MENKVTSKVVNDELFKVVNSKKNLMELGFGEEVNALIESGDGWNVGYLHHGGNFLIIPCTMYKEVGNPEELKKALIFFKDNPTMVEDSCKNVQEAKAWVLKQTGEEAVSKSTVSTKKVPTSNYTVKEEDVTGKEVKATEKKPVKKASKSKKKAQVKE